MIGSRIVFTGLPTFTEYPLMILYTTCGTAFLMSSANLVYFYLSIVLQSCACHLLLPSGTITQAEYEQAGITES